MKPTILLKIFYFSIALTILVVSCKPKDKSGDPTGDNYSNGVIIVNEGSFQKSNASISYFNPDTKDVEKDIFKSSNGRPLGDVAQSVMIAHGKGYIVVNNSNKIEVVSANDFKSISTIAGLSSPRYMVPLSNSKAYLTEWVGFGVRGNVDVVDLSTNTVIKSIQVGESPEKMLILGGKLYVVNSTDSTLMIINTVTDETEDTIKVGDSPNSIVSDLNNNIWVVCGGKKIYTPPTYDLDVSSSTAGSLVKLDYNGHVLQTFGFSDKAESPSNLIINKAKDILYYNYAGAIYSFPINSASLASIPFINRNFYGIGMDPKNDLIYGGQAKDFSQTDYVFRYTNTGLLLDSFNVGIAPNGFAFNY